MTVCLFWFCLVFREQGQGTVDELRNRDFRKELEEREREVKEKAAPRRLAIEPSREAAAASAKRPKVDQVPAASLDADDPLDEDESDSESDDDDTEALMAELQRIRKERAAEQAKKVIYLFAFNLYIFFYNLTYANKNLLFFNRNKRNAKKKKE